MNKYEEQKVLTKLAENKFTWFLKRCVINKEMKRKRWNINAHYTKFYFSQLLLFIKQMYFAFDKLIKIHCAKYSTNERWFYKWFGCLCVQNEQTNDKKEIYSQWQQPVSMYFVRCFSGFSFFIMFCTWHNCTFTLCHSCVAIWICCVLWASYF